MIRVNMQLCFIFAFIFVGCHGIDFNKINEFNEFWADYEKSVELTITSVQQILNNTLEDSNKFFEGIFENNAARVILQSVNRNYDSCNRYSIDRSQLKFSFDIQFSQLQLPLYTRINDLKEKLYEINSGIDIYQRLTENKLLNCHRFDRKCVKETELLLKSKLQSFYCSVLSDCQTHNINKRSLESFSYSNCSIESGNFLCDGDTKCIGLEKVCNDYIDCEDKSDESVQCYDSNCTEQCNKSGGICLSGPSGPQCLYECPPGMFETSSGCRYEQDVPPSSLSELIDEIPPLIFRYETRLKYLKAKTVSALFKSTSDFVNCKKDLFTSLSNAVRFSKNIQQHENSVTTDKQSDVETTTIESSETVKTTNEPLEPSQTENTSNVPLKMDLMDLDEQYEKTVLNWFDEGDVISSSEISANQMFGPEYMYDEY